MANVIYECVLFFKHDTTFLNHTFVKYTHHRWNFHHHLEKQIFGGYSTSARVELAAHWINMENSSSRNQNGSCLLLLEHEVLVPSNFLFHHSLSLSLPLPLPPTSKQSLWWEWGKYGCWFSAAAVYIFQENFLSVYETSEQLRLYVAGRFQKISTTSTPFPFLSHFPPSPHSSPSSSLNLVSQTFHSPPLTELREFSPFDFFSCCCRSRCSACSSFHIFLRLTLLSPEQCVYKNGAADANGKCCSGKRTKKSSLWSGK